MPKLNDIRERLDNVLYDTNTMEPGQQKTFLMHTHVDGEHVTNMRLPGVLPSDQTFAILAIGLRLLGKSEAEEDRLLDHFTVDPTIGDKPYGPFPGSICSTLRKGTDDRSDELLRQATEQILKEGKANFLGKAGVFARMTLPGLVLVNPLMIPVRQNFYIRVNASLELPESCGVRAMLFGLRTRSVL